MVKLMCGLAFFKKPAIVEEPSQVINRTTW